MTDSSISIKDMRNTSCEEGQNVLAHKKKLAPISLATNVEQKIQKFTGSGSLIEEEFIITKDGIKIADPRTHSEMDISLSDKMGDMSIQSNQNMSIQSDFENPNANSKMSIQSASSELNKTKGDGNIFKVPQSKGGDRLTSISKRTQESVEDLFGDEKKTENEQLNIKFNDLKKVKPLGQGSQGSVDLMLHEPTSTYVALKSLALNTDENFQKQMKIELNTLRNCNCDNIIKCYGAFYQQGVISIALEYMDIGTLEDVLKAIGQIPEVILGAIAYQVLKGLEYLHKTTKIIHRDIKPSNLLINSQGEVKIADFGVSGKIDYTLEYKNSWVGTVTYMSPERFGGDRYNHDTDVWSLGLTLIECALGRFPYPEPGSVEPAPTLPQGFSPEIKDFVAVCLRKEGGTRSSATELLKHPFVKTYSKISTKHFKEWLKHLYPDKR